MISSDERAGMTQTYVLIHGGGSSGWHWHLIAEELRRRGHDVAAPDLPANDDTLTLSDYADAVVAAVGDRQHITVVGHSFGGFTAPLVAERIRADELVLVAGMIPKPGECPGDWWEDSGYNAAVRLQAARDGGLTGHDDPAISFFHDVPADLANEDLRHGLAHPSATVMANPWPLGAWPDVPTRVILCQDDRFFPAAFMRDLALQRLGIVAEEIPGSHCVALSRPAELAEMLTTQAYRMDPPVFPLAGTPDRHKTCDDTHTQKGISMAEILVSRNEEDSRFEAHGGGQLMGYIDYTIVGHVIDLPHTLVYPEFEGQGVGSALARQTLDMIRTMDGDLKVQPTCPFIDVWIRRHKDYQDMLVD